MGTGSYIVRGKGETDAWQCATPGMAAATTAMQATQAASLSEVVLAWGRPVHVQSSSVQDMASRQMRDDVCKHAFVSSLCFARNIDPQTFAGHMRERGIVAFSEGKSAMGPSKWAPQHLQNERSQQILPKSPGLGREVCR